MIYTASYSGDKPGGSKALVVLIRLPGQRWRHLICFGRRGHYFADGGCEHTDYVQAELTPYGKKVTKVIPFGDGIPPKRFAKRPVLEGASA